MKIFANFDTKKGEELYQMKAQEFGEQNVVFLKRSRFYWYIHGLSRIAIFVLLNAVILFFANSFFISFYIFLGYIAANIILLYLFV